MAPFIQHTLSLHHPPLQQPLWLPRHHRAKGRLVLSDGGYPRPDSWGVLLCHTSTRPVVCSASRAQQQTRVFCNWGNYHPGKTDQPGKKPSTFVERNIESPGKKPSLLNQAKKIFTGIPKMVKYNGSYFRSKGAKQWMLKVLTILEKVAANKDNCSNHQDAEKLLDAAVQPIVDLHGLDDGARSSIVKASLGAIWKLLQTAPPEVGATMRREISSKEEVRTSMEKIRDTGGWDDETRNHAREILHATTQEKKNHGELP